MADENDEDEYFVPLTDQRVFGAGIKRKRIAFVPATSNDDILVPPPNGHSGNAGDRYLSIVLGNNKKGEIGSSVTPIRESTTLTLNEKRATTGPVNLPPVVCEICNAVITNDNDGEITTLAHQSSIVHQVCIQHSHPPSHLDRDRAGLRYLTGFGWDPDSRKGLGARDEGIRVPIKANAKHDTAGLGVNSKLDDDDDDVTTRRKVTAKKEERVVKLNAKETRKVEEEKRKRAERLRQVFYGEDLSRYLGPGG